MASYQRCGADVREESPGGEEAWRTRFALGRSAGSPLSKFTATQHIHADATPVLHQQVQVFRSGVCMGSGCLSRLLKVKQGSNEDFSMDSHLCGWHILLVLQESRDSSKGLQGARISNINNFITIEQGG